MLVNVLKYPFFCIAFDYAGLHGKTMLEGYAERGRACLWLFFAFNLFATVVNIAGGTLLMVPGNPRPARFFRAFAVDGGRRAVSCRADGIERFLLDVGKRKKPPAFGLPRKAHG